MEVSHHHQLQKSRLGRPQASPGCLRRGLVVRNVLAPHKTASSTAAEAPRTPSQLQQQPEQAPASSSGQWGWGPLTGLKLQWPTSSSAGEAQAVQQPQQQVKGACAGPAASCCLLPRSAGADLRCSNACTQVTQPTSQAILDVQAFLGTCSDEELRHMRILSHLCAQTYYLGQLTVSQEVTSIRISKWYAQRCFRRSSCQSAALDDGEGWLPGLASSSL